MHIEVKYVFDNEDQLRSFFGYVPPALIKTTPEQGASVGDVIMKEDPKELKIIKPIPVNNENKIRCAICDCWFTPVSKRSRLCSKKCVNIEQVAKAKERKDAAEKKESQPEQKEDPDAILARLRKEFPKKEEIKKDEYIRFM